jgi:hypothetical protein
VACDDDPVVMHGDLAGIEVDGRPLKTTNLAPSDPGRQLEEKVRCEPVALHRSARRRARGVQNLDRVEGEARRDD